MPAVEGLRSCYAKVGGLFHFGRMLDKIRLHAQGRLPADYQALMGKGFDGRVVRYLRVDHGQLQRQVLAGASDEEALEWCYANGRRLNAEDILILNSFLSKRGWRDDQSGAHNERVRREYGFAGDPEIETDFDLIERDEGRPLDQWRKAWGLD